MHFFQTIASFVAERLGRDSWLINRLRPAYEAFLGLSPWGIPWEINGVEYRIDPRHRCRMGCRYDAPVADFLRARVRPGDTCFNIGANVGVYVLQLAHWSRPDGRVVAFEPNPTARRVLERHIALNRLTRRVQVEPLAVGRESGVATLHAAGADGMSRLGSPNPALPNRADAISVPVVTLEDYCTAGGLIPDWIVMDIEGFEIAALAGARRWLQAHGQRLRMVIEMHPGDWGSAGTPREWTRQFLIEMQLTAVPLTGQNDALVEHGLVYCSFPSSERVD